VRAQDRLGSWLPRDARVDGDLSIGALRTDRSQPNAVQRIRAGRHHAGRRVYLTIARAQHNGYTGFEFEPSARVQWNLKSTQLLWAALSRQRAHRHATTRDLFVPSGLINAPPPPAISDLLSQGHPDFVSETVLAYEVVSRANRAEARGSGLCVSTTTNQHLRSTRRLLPRRCTFSRFVFFQNNLEGTLTG